VNIIISNYENLKNDNHFYKLVYFNPWGFSRVGIARKIIESLSAISIAEDDKIYFCLRDLFFGQRSQIAFDAVSKAYSKNIILKISEQDLYLLLNNSSI
jgi:hypothetical protein